MNKNIKILSFFLILSLLLSSCSKKPEKKPTTYEKKENAPQNLNKIYENTNLILKDIEEISKASVETEQKEVKLNEEKSKSEEKSKKESKEEKLKKLWKGIDKNIENIHKDWNNYEIEGMKKIGDTNSIGKFEESLNDFTVSIENRDHLDIISSGSKVLFHMSPFFDIYKDEIKGDISRIKYYVYQGYILGDKGEKEKAINFISQGEANLNSIRQKIENDKNKLKILEKLTLSLNDMKKSIEKESVSLFKIKRDIVLNNLKKLEE
ncbi:hypothetical protein CFK35_17210 [Clostridium sp. cpc1]|uniref:hypothetical protein n=1 Tax=Clostridium sp. cpc1 TaxID=2016536 RepID=UPI00223EEB1D|nr:hypothetical protein [Clostridium sp. cpc1]MCW7999624.1 hypothetical protein [Clostridium sp. cpc1]